MPLHPGLRLAVAAADLCLIAHRHSCVNYSLLPRMRQQATLLFLGHDGIAAQHPQLPTAPHVHLVGPGAHDRPRAGRYGPFRAPDPDSFLRMPTFRDWSGINSRSPTLLANELTDAAAPRAGPAAPGASRSRSLLEPDLAAIEAGRAFLHKRKGGQGSHQGWHHLDAAGGLGPSSPSGTPSADLDNSRPLTMPRTTSAPSESPAPASRTRSCSMPAFPTHFSSS